MFGVLKCVSIVYFGKCLGSVPFILFFGGGFVSNPLCVRIRPRVGHAFSLMILLIMFLILLSTVTIFCFGFNVCMLMLLFNATRNKYGSSCLDLSYLYTMHRLHVWDLDLPMVLIWCR